MGWMLRGVRDGDRPFVGREAIRRELVDGTSRWATVGDRRRLGGLGPAAPRRRLLPAEGRAARSATSRCCTTPTRTDGEQVGYVTSFCYSPVLQRHIGLARVRPDLAAPGTELHLEIDAAPPARTRSRSAPRRCPSSTPHGRRPSHETRPTIEHRRPRVRRHRRRRRPQRPGQRGVPRQGRAAHAGPRAARTSSAARRSPRSCVPGLLLHHVLLRAEPAAARRSSTSSTWSSTGSCR